MKKYNLNRWIPIVCCWLAMGCGQSDGYENDLKGYYEASYNGNITPDEPRSGKYEEFADNPFVNVADQPISTFSVDADGASYAIMRRTVRDAFYRINPSSVRIEEFLNYFTFDYPEPEDGQNVAVNAEVGECPWNKEHRLVRLGISGKKLKKDEVPQANFVFLIDVSGSMNGSDRLDMLKAGLIELLGQLNPQDRISIITYSGSVRKLLESTPVSEASKIKTAIGKLSASGSTAGGEALKMAYEEALANYNPRCNNRVIMGTDGDFNVGVTSTEELVEMVENYAKKGIYMTCLGFGMGNLNDAMMEKVSNSGNGTYHYIDCEDEMMKVFVHERERFVSVANDAKCQVAFDADYVSAYRLIGYENRVMKNEDFEDDAKDAGEIGAGQTITALYEIVPTEKFEQCLADKTTNRHGFATFDFRYKKSLSTASILLKVEIAVEDLYDGNGELRPLSDNLCLAAGIAAYGMVLRESPYKGDASLTMAANLVKKSLSFDPNNYRKELLGLIEMQSKIE